jgi:hypothetical protein
MKLVDAAMPKEEPLPKPKEVASDEVNGDERVIKRVVSKHIRTLAELATECEIDTKVWEIYRWKCGTWQTGMKAAKADSAFYSQQFVVLAWMRLRHDLVRANSEIEELRKKAAAFTPTYPTLKVKSSSSHHDIACEYSIMDHHIGALIWGKETGWADYDIKIAKKDYEEALTALIARTSGYGHGKAILVLGNDQQNFDNKLGTTTKGTPQDTDARYQKVFSVSRDVSIWAVEALLATHRSVDVIIVPGNHDYLASWHLGDSLQSWFRKCGQVTVDNRPPFRKYYQFGVNMLLFTHGSSGKLEAYDRLMAAEQPEMWGRTLWREAHTGDKHQRRLIELRGAAVRILPSLRPPDAWTAENQYVGTIRAAEAYVWHRREGLQGIATYSILKDATQK